MINIKWYINRLKAMNVLEVIWRFNQKNIQKTEKKLFYNKPVINSFFYDKLKELELDHNKLHLNLKNKNINLDSNILMLGNFNYQEYKMKWDSGFQTNNVWPKVFSYKLNYKGKDEIGDARTNWELNRHHQLTILAKNYFASKDKEYLTEFEKLFYDWNEKNLFLSGISWTSVMEVAIRLNNWIYAFWFLKESKVSNKLLNDLKTGILNMTEYICKHYSKYSSANNHLIVEAYAILQSGILFNYQLWIKLAMKILKKELKRQNYKDGVNKEVSLHYQVFILEAYGLIYRLLKKNKMEIPSDWNSLLDKMCGYLNNCMGKHLEVVEFGDNDDGKILSLNMEDDYYNYVLSLYGFLLDKKYIDYDCETLNWLFDKNDYKLLSKKIIEEKDKSICYKNGGITILRSDDDKILIGIDHGELGFGKIAAHGHADALSFQMYVNGKPLFVDPGTYLYHCDIDNRNYFRKTLNHNTICVNNKDQSKMLGAFLWGKRAKCKLIDYNDDTNINLKVSHNGYKPIIHTRKFIFDKKNKLEIIDSFNKECSKIFNLNFAPNTKINIDKDKVHFKNDYCKGSIIFDKVTEIKIVEKKYSKKYGVLESIESIECLINGLTLKTSINIEEN